MGDKVVILGAGLSGLAAATGLARLGFAVVVVESRNRLGGRAASFDDAATGQVLDVCQHVSMGCCTNFAHFARTIGVGHLLRPQAHLFFMTPDRRISRFQADRLPAPLHLARSFLTAHYLRPDEKLRVAWGLHCLQRAKPAVDERFINWLGQHRQTARTISRFWGVVLTSALNEGPERVGLRYARKVFVDGFLEHPRGFEVELPQVPLSRLYGEEMMRWLERHGVQMLLGNGARRIVVEQDGVSGVELRDGSTITADWYIAAVPFDRLLDLLPQPLVNAEPYFGNLRQLETSPITSVHLWYDRPVCSRGPDMGRCSAGSSPS
jgi:squalene-associated FAD-dependent desaturase